MPSTYLTWFFWMFSIFISLRLSRPSILPILLSARIKTFSFISRSRFSILLILLCSRFNYSSWVSPYSFSILLIWLNPKFSFSSRIESENPYISVISLWSKYKICNWRSIVRSPTFLILFWDRNRFSSCSTLLNYSITSMRLIDKTNHFNSFNWLSPSIFVI